MLVEGSVLASQWWKTEVSWNASWILGYHRLMNRHSSTASRRCGNHFGMVVFLLSLERDSWTMKWWMWAFWAFCFIFTAVVEEAVSLLWIWILSLVTWLLQRLCLWRVVGGSLNHIVKPKDHLCQEWKENCVMPSSTSPQFADFAGWGGNSTKMNLPEGREGQFQSQESGPHFSPGFLVQSQTPSTSVQLPS